MTPCPKLGETDRTALVLRFFENKTAREIAGLCGWKRPRAQKTRGAGAGKLRALFVKRGVTLTATVIAGAVAANSVQARAGGTGGDGQSRCACCGQEQEHLPFFNL